MTLGQQSHELLTDRLRIRVSPIDPFRERRDVGDVVRQGHQAGILYRTLLAPLLGSCLEFLDHVIDTRHLGDPDVRQLGWQRLPSIRSQEPMPQRHIAIDGFLRRLAPLRPLSDRSAARGTLPGFPIANRLAEGVLGMVLELIGWKPPDRLMLFRRQIPKQDRLEKEGRMVDQGIPFELGRIGVLVKRVVELVEERLLAMGE